MAKEPKLIVGLQVYNEADKFLAEWVEEVESYADAFVVLDDDSTDETRQILAASSKIRILEKSPQNMFQTNEIWLRKRLWSLLKSVASVWHKMGHPVWILLLDADEFMEEKFKRNLKGLMGAGAYQWYGLKFLHFWRSREFYRVDKMWGGSVGPRMVRYNPNFKEQWRETPLHCGSLPKNIISLAGKNIDFNIKHYGYVMSPEDKHKRYTKLDPQAKWCPKSHYDSILDKSPKLVKWKERA